MRHIMEFEALWRFIGGVFVEGVIIIIILNIVANRAQRHKHTDFRNSPLEDNNETNTNEEEHHTGESQDKFA